MFLDDKARSFLISIGIVAIVAWLAFSPLYHVYSQQKAGEARLKEAQSSREIAVLEAKAKLESAKLLADSEIERAKGVAKANEIVGSSLKNNSEYLQYLYITGLQEQPGHQGDRTVIYIPTEKGFPIPITESTRLAPTLPKNN